MATVEEAVIALGAGELVVLPTDTVYGLAAAPYEEPVRRISRLKQRPETTAIALVARDVDFLLECIPELRGRDATIARALLPGPYTLVLRNPDRRFHWLTAKNPHTIGVRVPELHGPGAAMLDEAGAFAATSANLHGGPDPATLAEVPAEILSGVSAVVDGGELPGTASTVIDFTGSEPRVLREGAAPSTEAIDRVSAALG